MFKGCSKKMIMLKNTGSGIFDEAYFILKESAAKSDKISESDMISEANRILSENRLSDYCGKNVVKNKKSGIFLRVLFIFGCLALVALAIFLTVKLV